MIFRKSIEIILFIALISVASIGCDSLFGSKTDPTNDEIFEVGKIDPALENIDGYAPVLPVWSGFDAPTDIHVGFDTFVYVTDAVGLHLLDRADLRPRVTIPLEGAVSITQDRLLNVYVSARIDTVINQSGVDVTYNLPAVFKIKNMAFVDTLIFPFDDASLSTSTAQNARLSKGSTNNYEKVKITGVSVLADNNIYVSRTGPLNSTQQVAAPDNTVLEFTRRVVNGEKTDKMVNIRQLVTLNPQNPSLKSAIGLGAISSFVAPPQRDRLTDDRSFLITQIDQNIDIDFRVLWIKAELTTDGMAYLQNSSLLAQDTSKADGFIYEPGKFQKPVDIAVSGDDDAFIFVVDEAQNMLYQFQSNGYEGVNPPAGADQSGKKVIVSFGGKGVGPKQFDSPSGVAYFRKVLYVTDKGNNRVLRFRLTSDFE
ncbi:MAG: hypothetical protein WC967_06080 [Balneolaceae bacterium]